MSRITTHVLDTARGKPAAGVEVTLERSDGKGAWSRLASARTDGNGRIADFLDAGPLTVGMHRLTFATAAYFKAQAATTFFPSVEVVFSVTKPDEHHHVPLLLSPFSYSTYRGS